MSSDTSSMPTSFPGSLSSASLVVEEKGGRGERPWNEVGSMLQENVAATGDSNTRGHLAGTSSRGEVCSKNTHENTAVTCPRNV